MSSRYHRSAGRLGLGRTVPLESEDGIPHGRLILHPPLQPLYGQVDLSQTRPHLCERDFIPVPPQISSDGFTDRLGIVLEQVTELFEVVDPVGVRLTFTGKVERVQLISELRGTGGGGDG